MRSERTFLLGTSSLALNSDMSDSTDSSGTCMVDAIAEIDRQALDTYFRQGQEAVIRDWSKYAVGPFTDTNIAPSSTSLALQPIGKRCSLDTTRS